ncbi:MAG: Ig-like domain-containing protein [Oscillospiraceae bacterium]|nr:Ig-like domain-containing protein [Oscillospiraceae bacterium]
MAKTMKSLLSVFLAVLMVCSLMIIPSSAASISISKSSINLTKGYQTTLKVNGTSKSVTWSTGDKSVATVSSKGKVVGKGVGTTYIYAKVSGTTLKCKVNVVPSKITASSSNVTLDGKGSTKTVTMTVKGSHSGLSVGSTNKKVATASWVKPVEWDGDKIKLKITAKGEGEAKIKVYLKKYPSTCYKYINVSVGDPDVYEEDLEEETQTLSKISIVPYVNSVSVDANGSYKLQVYSANHNSIAYQFADSSIASLAVENTAGLYRNYVITGKKAGTTTLRLYNKNNVKNYTDIKITVGSDASYYTLVETKPATFAVGDKVINVQVNNKNYYMLVPANYDPAYTNTIVASKFNKYSYYTIYDKMPARLAAGDTYIEFTNMNTTYINPNYSSNVYYNNNYGTKRYVLLPKNHDKVKLNTLSAQYNNKYDYWTIYNVSPTVSNTWADYVETWIVTDPATGKNTTRYMLVPYSEWDQDKIDKIKAEDMNSNSGYSYYQVYAKYPTIDAAKDLVVMYTKNGAYRYMVVPIENTDVVKRNDAIKNDTGVYEPYIMYSTAPTPNTTAGEYVVKSQFGSKYIYVLCTYPQNSTEHANLWATVSTAAPKGN